MGNQVITVLVQSDDVIDGINVNLTELETDVNTLESGLATTNSNLSTLSSTVTSLDGRVDTTETQIDVLDSAINALDTRIDATESDISSIQGDLISLAGTDTNLQGSIEDVTEDITALDTRLDTVESDLDDTRLGIQSASDLATAIAADKTNAVEVKLASGEYSGTATINITNGSGGMLTGFGTSDVSMIQSYSNALVAQNSVVKYTGTKTAGTPHIYYDRGGYKISDVTFLGKNQSDVLAGTGTNTPIWLKMVRASGAYAGIGSGKLNCYDVGIAGYDLGLEVAQASGDLNCDESSFYNLNALQVGTLMRTNNLQGMGFAFYNLRCGVVDTAFEYFGGGKLKVFGAFIAQPTKILQFRNDSLANFGHNPAKYVFRDVDFDAQAHNSMCLDMEPGAYYADILFDGNHWGINGSPGPWTTPAFNVADSTSLRVTNAKNLQAGMFSWNTSEAKSTIMIDNCRLWTNVSTANDLFDLSSSTGTIRVIVRDCVKYHSFTYVNLTETTLTGTA